MPAAHSAVGETEKIFTVNDNKTIEFEFVNHDNSEELSITLIKLHPITYEAVENARLVIYRYTEYNNNNNSNLYKANSSKNGYEPLNSSEYPPSNPTAGLSYRRDYGYYVMSINGDMCYSFNFWSDCCDFTKWKDASGNSYEFSDERSSHPYPYVTCSYTRVWNALVPTKGKKGDEDYEPEHMEEFHSYGSELMAVPANLLPANWGIKHYARAYLNKSGQFDILSGDPGLNYEIATNSEGMIVISGLESDLSFKTSYYAYETYAPEKFKLYNYGQEFKIGSTGGANNELKHKIKKKIYEWTPKGRLEIEKIDEWSGAGMSGVKFRLWHEEYGWLVTPGQGVDKCATYTSDESEAGVFTTGADGKIVLDFLELGEYTWYEDIEDMEQSYPGYEAKMGIDGNGIGKVTVTETITNTETDTGTGTGTSTGTGTGTETDTGTSKVTVTAYNRWTYLKKLEGYVWEDEEEGKTSLRNNLWDSGEKRLAGVTVKLLAMRGDEIIEEYSLATETDGNGHYEFTSWYGYPGIPIGLLNGENDSNYSGMDFSGIHCYIEFDYDGLTYEAVEPIYTAPNGSKAVEIPGTRDRINNNFARVEGIEGSNNQVQAKDSGGTVQSIVQYELHWEEYRASVESATNAEISARTNDNYPISVDRSSNTEVLSGYNLGVYKRQQADVALTQDIDSANVGIKGYWHLYNHAKRIPKNSGDLSDDMFEPGIKFDDYKQPIYRADAVYSNPGDTLQELQIILTYKVALKNQSSLVTTAINSIVDYYDNRYTFYKAGTSITGRAQIEAGNELEAKQRSSANNKYKAVEIDLGGIALEPFKTKYIYVQFVLHKEQINELLAINNGEESQDQKSKRLQNVAEITSYSSTKDGKPYATVDKDAVLDNVELDNEHSYEDDTREAPGLTLIEKTPRKITGFAFEDLEIQKLLEENIRQGDGSYDKTKEKLLTNIEVQLLEAKGNESVQILEICKDENGNEVKTKLDDTGKYQLEGFTPGKYILRFVWGENGTEITSTVDDIHKQFIPIDYKSTIFEKERYDKALADGKWYRNMTEEEKLKSVALDRQEIRRKIDTQLNSHSGGENNGYNYNTRVTQRTMESDTPILDFAIERDDEEGDVLRYISDYIYRYTVEGMNLGIVRRPIQSINMEKRVANVKLLYANGETIVNANIGPDGQLSGETNYTAYIAGVSGRRGGIIRLEADEEILDNAGVQAIYDYTITNTSEIDYITTDFYNHGIKGTDEELVTMSPTVIMDYLDTAGTYMANSEINANNGWQIVKVNELGEQITRDPKQLEAIKETAMYKTTKLTNSRIQPGKTANLQMEIERRLSTQEEEKDKNIVNQVEIICIDKPYGSQITTTPGNYVPAKLINDPNHETDDSMSEQIIVISSQGGNKNYMPYISIALTALIAIAGGIYFIKKKQTK